MEAPVAVKLTQQDIDDLRTDEQYHQFPGTTTTVCCITLHNGYTIVGSSACIDPLTFDAKVGRELAMKDAMSKVWELEGYLLKEKMFQVQVKKNALSAAPSEQDGEP